MLGLIRNLIVVLALVLGVAFGFFNFAQTRVDLLWTTTQAPLVVLLVIALVIGFLLALVICSGWVLRLRRSLARSRRQLRDARVERAHSKDSPAQKA